MPDTRQSVTIENARLIFRNFSGRETRFKPEGYRSFAVELDQRTAEKMSRDGWNVKFPDPREEGEERNPYIEIAVGYKIRPPRVVMITSGGKVNLDEHSIEVLDWADIAVADLIAVASQWEVGGKSGIKAYLKSLFVTIEEDELERKYGINEMA